MTSIGCRCRGGNVHSRAILITQTLSRQQCQKQRDAEAKRIKRYDAAEVVGVISRSVERREIHSRPQNKAAGRSQRRIESSEKLHVPRSYFHRSFSPYNVAWRHKTDAVKRRTTTLRWQKREGSTSSHSEQRS